MKLPIFIEVSGLNVLIIGGGEEALKKSKRFSEAGAKIKIFSLELCEDLEKLAKTKNFEVIKGDARNHDLLVSLIKEADIVISTLNDAYDIDTLVISICREFRKFYILAGDASRTMCGMGIEGKSGEFRFAVYTDGKSSIVAMEARDRIKKFLDEQNDLHVKLEVLGKIKAMLKEAKVPSDLRIKIHRKISEDEVFIELSKNSKEEAMKRAMEIVKENLKVIDHE